MARTIIMKLDMWSAVETGLRLG